MKNKQKEMQIDLEGHRVQHHNNPIVYSSIYFKYDIFWKTSNRVVETLKHFYFSRLLSRAMISKKYKSSISDNSISKHIKQLVDEKLIRLIARNVGVNRSEKYFELTSKGEEVYDTLLKEKDL